LQNQIANWLRLRSIFFIRSRMDKKTTTAKGTPDFAFCMMDSSLKAVAVALEVKTQSKMTVEQKRVREQMESNGWHYHVVGSLQEVMDIVLFKEWSGNPR